MLKLRKIQLNFSLLFLKIVLHQRDKSNQQSIFVYVVFSFVDVKFLKTGQLERDIQLTRS